MAFDDGVKTVSGSIAHTDDAATKVPFVSVKCGIEPTLSGVSEVSATQTGENLFDKSAVIDNTWIVVNDTTTESAVGYRTSDYIPVKANTRYYVSTKGSNRTAYYGKNKNGIAYFSFSGGQSFNCLYDGYIRITINNNIDLDTFVVNEGNTAITYEPYNGTTYTASLGRTIHGGQVDIVNGVGKSTRIKKTVRWGDLGNVTQLADVTRKEIVLSASEEPKYITVSASTDLLNNKNLPYDMTYSGNFEHIYIANSARIWVYLPNGTDANTEITVSYTLADALQTDFTFTPITPTPETVGEVNNVYCNTGNTELTYYDNAHGFAEVTVNKTGKNLWSSDKDLSITRDKTMYMRIPRGTYTLSFDFVSSTASPVPSYMQVAYSTTDGTKYNPVTVVEGRCSRTFTLSADARALTIYSSTSYSASVGVTTVVNNIQLEVGSQASSYEPYEAVSKTAYLHKVIYGGQADVVKGTCEPKNLFDGGNYFPISEEMTNSYYKEFSATTGRMPRIELVVGTTYTFSLDVTSTVEPFTISIGTGDGRYLKDIANKGYNNSGRVSITFTPTTANIDKGAIMAFRVPRYGTTQNFSFSISNVQLEVSPSASDYTPYFEPFTFPPISIGTDEGENTLFANEGDSAITYRKAVD